ncbi:MAG: phosphoglycerate kinase [Planctomycetes bacterium]|nr:phosphoglycerate kinase [Planctomycetota bacterium]
MTFRTLQDIDVRGKRVLVRVDFNVPLEKDGSISDDTRITASLPTIQALLDRGASLVLMSHLGRPKGVDPSQSLRPVHRRLSELLPGRKVNFADDCVGAAAEGAAAALTEGQVLLLENVRFHKEEEKGDKAFAASLAKLGQAFVNDAFGSSHRAHCSVSGVADHLPSAAGLLLQKELDAFDRLMNDPGMPFVAILGGSKVSDKIAVVENLVGKVQTLIVGGAMAYAFLRASGQEIGSSRFEEADMHIAMDAMAKARFKGTELLLPVDHVVTQTFDANAESRVVEGDIPEGWMGLDIGPKTVELFSGVIGGAKRIVWNGPMGVFEFEKFAAGTRGVARAVAESGAFSFVGGGDSVAAIQKLGFGDRVSHLSTGGGASLELLEGKDLPGVACLRKK